LYIVETGGVIMGDTLTTIIAIFLAAILMFIFPLLSIAERGEDVTQLAVQTTSTEFVNKIATTGAIRSSDYDMFVQRLAATGNTYSIELEIQHLDENPGKKGIATSQHLIGENVRYSTFTSSILDVVNGTGGVGGQPYLLKQGDIVIVNVKNTNRTIAQLLRGFFYQITGQGTFQVAASHSSMVVNNGRN
jgi:hypothetical protein